ncbi:glutamine-rich protein 2-like [Mixophyes fleayi]|uniref:glutamine-rich protein 2-like n=1 Tax=Mixophyes fleayi TaxID=3061075 RepID=UPI003F4E20B1
MSREEFDATTVQLNNLIKNVISREIGQEQDWQKVLQKINYEMQKKLDRMAFNTMKKNVEKQWKKIFHLLKKRPPQYDNDEAAGIRKQLIARFNCDHPVKMAVLGQQILPIPSLARLQSRRSSRLYTLYDLEEVQQHGRSGDYGYTSSARSCGGKHTLTFSRCTRLQGINTPQGPQEKESVVGGLKQREANIPRLDGQKYHGGKDMHFPDICTKDGNSKSRRKCSQGSQITLPALGGSTSSDSLHQSDKSKRNSSGYPGRYQQPPQEFLAYASARKISG